MARSKKKQIVEETVVGAAAGGPTGWILMKLLPRRWHLRSLFLLVAVLVGLGVLKLRLSGEQPGVRIDLERSAQIELKAEQLLKAAADRLQKNR